MPEDVAKKRVQVTENSCSFLQVILATTDPIIGLASILNEHAKELQLLGMSNVSESEILEQME